jgi:tetratricopeptide (TPR) repeat protein
MMLMGLLAVVACTQNAQAPEPVEGPSPQLMSIDSLLWHQPDSALACILPYFDTCRDAKFCVSTATEYNRHYANLLLSELLYKNDYAQVNRAELLQAVAYFDSLLSVDGADTRGVSLQARPRRDTRRASAQNMAFLDARAHYINGVGYYENDSVVEACAEYLKTLEVMENHFEEKELVKHKARFMALTYGRLGDIFSDQFMMESSITCYEHALFYCRIEPTSPTGVSNLLTRLGVQYDKLGNKEKMRDYYGQALEAMPSSDNLSYRDLAASKALCDYQLGLGIDHSLAVLRRILVDANDKEERKTRFLTIGAIFAEEGMYDSAMYYLEPLFENEVDLTLKISAAECLRTIYDSIGDDEKLDKCLRFMALQKKSEAQNKALVSQLDDLFKSYTNKKLQNEAEKARDKSIRKTIEIIVPIAVVVALAILIMSKLRSKRLLKEQQVEADKKFGESEQQHEEELRQRKAEAEKMLEDKEKHHQQEMEAKEAETKKELEERDKQHAEAIEAERQTHRMEQASLSGRLKRSNQEVRELKDQIKQLDDLAAKSVIAASFDEEPVCRLIMERVKDGQFKSKIDYIIYKDSALNKQQLLDLRLAVDCHFRQFTVRLKKAYPELTNVDLDYCCLYLLGLTDADIAALMQRAYNTVIERNGKLKKIFGEENTLSVTLRTLANDSSFI